MGLLLLIAAVVCWMIAIFRHPFQVSLIAAGLACAGFSLWVLPHTSLH
jgi:hypothetical protein